ncbi:hypothetical protein CFC21_106857 [Triticum aestivum]|uniref:RING-type domain-containing protein n=6 Tax=Triticinae TaxID=1648030 RepID=A0A9R1MEW8_WHEAT|nr:E3 ubiquitin-protein ligase BIG BROTHER [Aegilops tauschii subsp. strangulata]XP_044438538.1 E3 ubiquitin-protein ligase BIG BROTHER-like [Triticum aestivum]KAF7106096.1 hypothetical protein CFC21_106857 [Triticum aestivum]
MATVGPPGAFRRITVHYSSTAGDDANHDDFLEYVIGDVLQHQEGLHQSFGTGAPGASWSMHCCHGESSRGTAAETSGTSDEQIAADLKYARMLQEMEDLDVNTPPNNDEQDDISCVPSPSDTDDDDDRGDEEEAARQDDDDNDDTDDDVDPDNMTYEERQELVESVGNESRGLSDELLSYLVPWKYRSGSGFFSRKTNHDDTCTVCLSAFRNRENIITLPCKHNYHASCISSWLKINRTCPVCKYEVFGPS